MSSRSQQFFVSDKDFWGFKATLCLATFDTEQKQSAEVIRQLQVVLKSHGMDVLAERAAELHLHRHQDNPHDPRVYLCSHSHEHGCRNSGHVE